MPGDVPIFTQKQVVDAAGRDDPPLYFHFNGSVVECHADPTSRHWAFMMDYAGWDVTLLIAQHSVHTKYGMPKCFSPNVS